MTKIVMLFWVLHSGQITDPQQFEGWRTMDECVVAAESFTEANPKERATYKYAVVATCVEIPK